MVRLGKDCPYASLSFVSIGDDVNLMASCHGRAAELVHIRADPALDGRKLTEERDPHCSGETAATAPAGHTAAPSRVLFNCAWPGPKMLHRIDAKGLPIVVQHLEIGLL